VSEELRIRRAGDISWHAAVRGPHAIIRDAGADDRMRNVPAARGVSSPQIPTPVSALFGAAIMRVAILLA